MLVGLLIFTLGATSASLFGFDFGFPIVNFEDVESGESCCDLRICRPAGAVVPGGSSWHLLGLGEVLLFLWCLGCRGIVVTGTRCIFYFWALISVYS